MGLGYVMIIFVQMEKGEKNKCHRIQKSLLAKTVSIGIKKTEYCKHWSNVIGRTEDAYYTVNTGADFYCEDAERKE